MIRRPPRSTLDRSSAASDVYKRQDYSGLVAEFTIYLKEKKSYWLAPIIFVLMALSALAFFLEGSVLAPAIYSVF